MNNTYAEVNLKNLQYNYNAIRRKTKKKVMAVVKADAYGHGMINCVEALQKTKVKPEYYGVALLDEAIELREAKITKEPILCFAPYDNKSIEDYLKYNIIPSLTSIVHVKQVCKIIHNSNFKVHLNINTGMNRLGIHYNDAFTAIKLLNKKNVNVDGIYTHYATSDEKDKTFAELQLNRFSKIVDELKNNNIKYGLAHTANSGAILEMPDTYFDMVRPGISLYGYTPSIDSKKTIDLKPVMSILSKISTISEVDKDDFVGYGRLFKANKKIKCGTIPIGYADGLLRALSEKINVINNDKIYKQIGRISMDRISINLNDDHVKTNSRVILLGKSKTISIDAWDWAKKLNTIPYEITCSISKRIPRKYVGIV